MNCVQCISYFYCHFHIAVNCCRVIVLFVLDWSGVCVIVVVTALFAYAVTL